MKQTLTWHALDSENMNVKLFRFAEKYGEQVYGVLFWAVTVIDCPEEIKDVRLAVGSNSASMWWLNGEETLLLSGDRLRVVRPSTKEWIASLKCDDYGGGLSYTGWKAGDIDITWQPHQSLHPHQPHKHREN